MSPNDPDHSRIWRVQYSVQIEMDESDSSDAERISGKIIPWLPLLAANDFLEDDDLPPVA